MESQPEVMKMSLSERPAFFVLTISEEKRVISRSDFPQRIFSLDRAFKSDKAAAIAL